MMAGGIGMADVPCADCRAGDRHRAQAAEFLAGKGYPQAGYELLVTWIEAAATDQNRHHAGSLIRGYRVRSRTTGCILDLYRGPSGELLDEDAAARFGVKPKDWTVPLVEVQTETPRGLLVPRPDRPRPRTTAPGLAPIPVVELDKPDMDAIHAEDAAREASTTAKCAMRTGVHRTLPDGIRVDGVRADIGAWQRISRGAVWAATVHSPDAVGQRIEFATLDLPQCAEVIVYNADRPEEAYGPYHRTPGIARSKWSATCFGERVTVECFVPDETVAKDVTLEVNRIAHIYRGFGSLLLKDAGACNLDVTCYPDWATAATAVAGIGSVDNIGVLLCTGFMIADTDPSTDIPYFLTANHCVSNALQAIDSEFYWLYQTGTCDGAPPNPVDVPRNTGADFLVGAAWDTSTDFSLLRLDAPPPDGTAYLGWTAAPQDVSLDTACIHHPDGDFKRISFGTTTDAPDPCYASSPPSLTRFHRVLWNEGTTEPGSSGSPLLRADTQQVIGQLHGGMASCSTPECPDYYGRFRLTFALVDNYLHPDSTEPEVFFDDDEVLVDEGAGEVVLQVSLDHGPGNDTAVIEYATASVTTRAESDYAHVEGALSFEGIETTGTVTITINDDTRYEGNEVLRVELGNPSGCVVRQGGASVRVIIIDDDIDTDGDGISDYDEEHAAFGFITDPSLPDTDGDGIDDRTEILFRSDPTSPDIYPQLGGLKPPFFSSRSNRQVLSGPEYGKIDVCGRRLP